LDEIEQMTGEACWFDTMLSVDNYPNYDHWFSIDYHGMKLTTMENRGYTHLPLTVFVTPGECLDVLIAYRSTRYVPQRLARWFEQLLVQIIEQPMVALEHYTLAPDFAVPTEPPTIGLENRASSVDASHFVQATIPISVN
jgi:hypothetical protein